MLEFSIQSNHLRCPVEAAGATDLARGMQGLAVRLARGWNRVLDRRNTVFAERYHARVLRSPREAAPWFAGWTAPLPRDELWMRRILAEPRPVASPETWLASTGWRRWGPLELDEVPAEPQRRRAGRRGARDGGLGFFPIGLRIFRMYDC